MEVTEGELEAINSALDDALSRDSGPEGNVAEAPPQSDPDTERFIAEQETAAYQHRGKVAAVPDPAEEPAPTRKATKPKRRGRPPSSASAATKKKIEDLFGDAEQIHIHRRNKNGQSSFICRWRPFEVEEYGTIEVMISDKLVPQYGGGEYHATAYNRNGYVMKSARYLFEGPTDEEIRRRKSGTGVDTAIATMMQRLESWEKNQRRQPTALDMLREVEEIKKSLNLGQDASSQVLPLLMAQLSKPQVPPELAALRNDLRSLADQVKDKPRSTPLAALPPPPPDTSLGDAIKMFAEMSERNFDRMLSLIEANRANAASAQPAGPDPTLMQRLNDLERDRERDRAEFQRALQAERDKHDREVQELRHKSDMDRMLAAIEDIKREMREGGQDPRQAIREMFENSAEMLEMARALAGQPKDGNNADTLFGFLNNVIARVPDMGSAIERVARAVGANARAEANAGETLKARESQGQAPTDRQLTQPVPEPQAEPKRSPPRQAKPTGVRVSPQVRQAIEDLTAAEDNDQESIRAVLTSLEWLRKTDQQGSRIVGSLLSAVRAGDKESVLEFISDYLDQWVKNGVLERRRADDTVRAFRRHYEVIVEMLSASLPGLSEDQSEAEEDDTEED